MSLHVKQILGVVAIAALVPGAAFAADAVAKINGQPISKQLVDTIVERQKAQGAQDSEELRKQVREQLIRMEVVAQEAKKKKLDKQADVAAQLDLARMNVLANAFLEDYAKTHPISDEQMKKEYDSIVAAAPKKEYKARHILVEKEDEAKGLITKLKGGAKFDDLAKASSKDPGSKERGGDLGWASPANYVKPFSDAMVKLEKGKYTDAPVKSDFGYHVILLDDVRDAKFPPFEETKPQISQRLQSKQIEDMIADLRKKAKVE